jgi:NADH-quinone oxidoreductase subunit F
MVDMAKYFLRFTNDESCGKCNSCREGSEALLEILNKISNGEGEESDIVFLEELGQAIKDASLCGLGQTLPNPVLSTLRHFKDEYIAHIKYKRCPGAVCKGIISSACQHTCPLGQDVPCYIGLIVQGKFEEAFKIIKKENPLPSVCSRVCHHPCESKCRSGEGGAQPIAIRALKRFLTDWARANKIEVDELPKTKNEAQIAIIGSGPAGLTCAFYLAREGYKVTIFESLPVAGGMLAVGIPEYRLPKAILKYEIEHIKKLGVEIKTNTTVGKDIQISDLKKEYKAIFIATGAHKGLKLGIPGEEAEGVIDAVEFLRKVNLNQEIKIGKRVVVVGGGNAAVDAARVAKRLGKDVQIIYRRTRQEMPAAQEEVKEVINEGIPIQFLVTPQKVISNNGKITALECIKMKLGEIDKSGRRRPIPIEGSEFILELDTLIPAIGQEPDILNLVNGSNLKISKWNTIEADPETFSTTEEGIFAGGDVVTGPQTVTEAMAQGKIAAQMIDKYIRGEPIKREYKVTKPVTKVEAVELTDEEIEKLSPVEMPTLLPEERIGNFKEVEIGFTKEMAIMEAKRCLRCDLEEEVSKNV